MVTRFTRGAAAITLGVGLAVGTATGTGAGIAQADVVDDLAAQYSRGAGAGQIAGLLDESLRLRSQGFGPRRSDVVAIRNAMTERPDQAPLVAALGTAVAAQRQSATEAALIRGEGGPTIAASQCGSDSWSPMANSGAWPPSTGSCDAFGSSGSSLILGGGQTITSGTDGRNGTDGIYRIGNGR